MSKPIPIKIKKYANRRLYNTATSCYVTLDDLAELIKKGEEFVVHDAKSNEDLTRQVLTQIIIEKETSSRPLLPMDFLKNIIRFYDNRMGPNLTDYLDMMMKAFTQPQPHVTKTLESLFPMVDFKKNQEMFEKMMGFYQRNTEESVETLRAEMAKLQEKIDKMSGK